jgi:AraC-like DNA-binding protein
MKNVPFPGSVSVRPPVRKQAASSRKSRLKIRDEWVRQLDSSHLFHRLFDLIPGVSFFAKNRRGEFMFTSRNIRDRYHLSDEVEIIGLTDFDLSPTNMAQAHVKDDEQIYRTGQPILDRIELGFDEAGVPSWFVVNKLPIRSCSGATIGVMGFYHSYQGREYLLSHQGVAKVVEYVRTHYQHPISIAEMARIVGLSVRQLQRKFKLAFGTGPYEFVIMTRLLVACRLLRETDLNATEIGVECGFSDQSSFTKHFRQHIGMTPRRYRIFLRSSLAGASIAP